MVHLDYHKKIGKAYFKGFPGLNFAIISFHSLHWQCVYSACIFFFAFGYWRGWRGQFCPLPVVRISVSPL